MPKYTPVDEYIRQREHNKQKRLRGNDEEVCAIIRAWKAEPLLKIWRIMCDNYTTGQKEFRNKRFRIILKMRHDGRI